MNWIFKKYMIIFFMPFYTSVHAQDYFDIHLAPFNSKWDNEFAPVFYNGGIVFCSDRKNDIFIHYLTKDEKPATDIFFVKQIDSLKWSAPKPFSKSINTVYHEGPLTFNKSGTLICFTRNMNVSKNITTKVNNLGLFFAEWSNGDWNNIRPFKYNRDSFNLAHPSLNAEGTMLYFSSDMPGGHGGSDIYMSYRENGTWSEPINLGPPVNSSSNEYFSYIHSSGRLYFSSDRPGGKGGLDIYFTSFKNDYWETPETFKNNFNSSRDDYGFVVDDSFEKGFFTSNRNSSDDIYMFVSTIPYFGMSDSIQENDRCYVFYEEGDFDFIEGEEYISSDEDTLKEKHFSYVYEWDLGDGTKIRGLEVEHCFQEEGTYVISLNVIDTLTGEIMQNEATYEFEHVDIEQVYITSKDTVQVNIEADFSGEKTTLKGFNITGYYWDFGDGTRSIGKEVRHTFKDSGKYKVRLGVTGYYENEKKIEKKSAFKQVVVLDK